MEKQYLAIGLNKGRPGKQRNRGFTLIELLIVILILSIVAGFATLGMNAYLRDREMRLIAEQLKIIIPEAQSQAILRVAVLGLLIKPQAYAFYQFIPGDRGNAGQWKIIQNNHLFRGDTTSSNITLTVHSEISANERLLDATTINPQIVFFTDGTLTPFVLHITATNENSYYEMRATAGGELTVKKVNKQ